MLSCLISFSWNLDNWKASTEKTKNSLSVKIMYFQNLSHSLFCEEKIPFKILFWIFDWRHQIEIWERSIVGSHSWDNIVPICSICSRFSDYMLDMFVHNTQMLLKCMIMYEMLKKLLLFIHILPFYVQRYFIAAVDVLTPVCGWAVL